MSDNEGVRPDNRWVRAVPGDSDLLPLRSVLDEQIRGTSAEPTGRCRNVSW